MTRTDWDAARRVGAYTGSDDDARDGFIHLSSYAQLAGTLHKHFNGRGDLVLIEYDAGDLGPELRWEPSRGGELFPHLYKELPTPIACSVTDLVLDAGGTHILPQKTAQ